MSDNTARRERAEWWIENRCERGNPRLCGFKIDWLHSDVIDAYLAGAREEAAEKEKIIRNLSDAMEVGKEIVSRSVALITDRDAEIAALKREVEALRMMNAPAAP